MVMETQIERPRVSVIEEREPLLRCVRVVQRFKDRATLKRHGIYYVPSTKLIVDVLAWADGEPSAIIDVMDWRDAVETLVRDEVDIYIRMRRDGYEVTLEIETNDRDAVPIIESVVSSRLRKLSQRAG